MAHEWSHGHFYWNELMTRDAEKAKKFYGDTVGWTFEAMPMPDGTYWVAKMGDAYVGGLFPADQPEVRWRAGRLDVLSRGRRRRCASEEGAVCRREIDAADFRRAWCRPHRHSDRAGRRRHRLDDAAESIKGGVPCNTRSSPKANGLLHARRCLPRKRNSPRRVIN